MQIQGYRDSTLPKVEDVVKQNWLSRRDKLIRIGLSYDLAHAKGQVEDAAKAKDKKDGDNKDVAAVATAIPSDAAIATTQAPVSMQTADLEPLGGGYDAAADPTTAAPADPPAEKPVDPWNAPLVVGLRVFCYKTTATISVKTIKSENVTVETKGKLDVDDPEKDVVESAEKKKDEKA